MGDGAPKSVARAGDDTIERLAERVASTTHAKQAGIAEQQQKTDRKLGLLSRAMSRTDLAKALDKPKVH